MIAKDHLRLARKYRRNAKEKSMKCDRIDRYQTHDLSEAVRMKCVL